MANVSVESKHLEDIVVGKLTALWSASGDRILRYYIDFRHKKLNLHKELSAPEIFILQAKVDALMASWDEKTEQHNLRHLFQSGKDLAEESTVDAEARLDSLTRILNHTLLIDDRVNWEALKDNTEYEMPKKFAVPKPVLAVPPPPVRVTPAISIFDVLLGRKAVKLQAAEDHHRQSTDEWQAAVSLRKAAHEAAVAEWEERQRAFWADHELQKATFVAAQAERIGELMISSSRWSAEIRRR